MATDERARHLLYQRLEDTLGPEPATTLMEHLPPTGWADVATKADVGALRGEIVALEQRIDLRFDRIDDRFAATDDRVDNRFDRIDDRFAAIDDRFAATDDRVDNRFDRIDDRFDRIDDRFAAIDDRFAGIDGRFGSLEETIDIRLQSMEHKLLAAFRAELVTAISAQTRPFLLATISMFITFAAFVVAVRAI